MNANAKQLLGRLGEDEVTRRYAEKGYRVVARNLHMSHNEIDLILQSDTHLAFVEVKTRHAVPGTRSRFGRPADAVTRAKRARTVEAVQAYLREHPTSLQPRIDVAEVYVTHRADGCDEVTEVLIFQGAFGAR